MSEFRKPQESWLGRLGWWLVMRPLYFLDFDLWFLSTDALRAHLLNRLILAICSHRDQRGDDRCWFDDLWLYWHLPESVRYPVKLSQAEMAERCAYYHRFRSHEERPSHGSAIEQSGTNECHRYIFEMSRLQLLVEARRLRKGIRKHRDKGMFKRTVADDKELYALVRDGIEADFRLPPAELFLANCALICSLVNPEHVDLSCWPEGRISPLAGWRPDDYQVLSREPAASE